MQLHVNTCIKDSEVEKQVGQQAADTLIPTLRSQLRHFHHHSVGNQGTEQEQMDL